jgi:outer membrane protein assembly factor BamB
MLQGEVKLGGSIYNTPAVVGGRVYVAVRAENNDPNVGKVIGVSASDLNKIEFEFDAASTVDASLVIADNYLYFGADNGNFYQVSTTNPAQSKILFRANRLFNVNSVVVANGWVYVSNADGNLYMCK